MTDKELIVIKRALTNMLMSMVKAQDAPASAEMHIVESVVALAKILNVNDFKDSEMNEQFTYCLEIMKDIDSLKNNTIVVE